MNPLYGGILGFLAEACDIQREMGCSVEEANEIQRQRAAERLQEYQRQQAETADSIRLDRVAVRVAENLGCSPEEARQQLDYWDAVHAEQFSEDNVIPFRARH